MSRWGPCLQPALPAAAAVAAAYSASRDSRICPKLKSETGRKSSRLPEGPCSHQVTHKNFSSTDCATAVSAAKFL